MYMLGGKLMGILYELMSDLMTRDEIEVCCQELSNVVDMFVKVTDIPESSIDFVRLALESGSKEEKDGVYCCAIRYVDSMYDTYVFNIYYDTTHSKCYIKGSIDDTVSKKLKGTVYNAIKRISNLKHTPCATIFSKDSKSLSVYVASGRSVLKLCSDNIHHFKGIDINIKSVSNWYLSDLLTV